MFSCIFENGYAKGGIISQGEGGGANVTQNK